MTDLPAGEIRTSRLALRPASERHAGDLQNYYRENRAHLQPWLNPQDVE